MSDTVNKRVTVDCNGDFIHVEGRIWYSILGFVPDNANVCTDINTNNAQLGQIIVTCMQNSQELTKEEWATMFGTNTKDYINLIAQKYEKQYLKLIQECRYKNKQSLCKNMMACTVISDVGTIVIKSTLHSKLDVWEGTDENCKIALLSPPAILGATVRYAFSRCKGKGPYAKGAEIVTKALFPNGVPNSLEEYLESGDPNYEKWLVRE
jgi:hypothetical protein